MVCCKLAAQTDFFGGYFRVLYASDFACSIPSHALLEVYLLFCNFFLSNHILFFHGHWKLFQQLNNFMLLNPKLRGGIPIIRFCLQQGKLSARQQDCWFFKILNRKWAQSNSVDKTKSVTCLTCRSCDTCLPNDIIKRFRKKIEIE